MTPPWLIARMVSTLAGIDAAAAAVGAAETAAVRSIARAPIVALVKPAGRGAAGRSTDEAIDGRSTGGRVMGGCATGGCVVGCAIGGCPGGAAGGCTATGVTAAVSSAETAGAGTAPRLFIIATEPASV